MTKVALSAVLTIGAAILLGYFGAALMATVDGREFLAAAAVLIALLGVAECARMAARPRLLRR